MIKNFNPKTVVIGNYIWMAENLALDDGKDGIFYNPENKEYYYTLKAANRIARKLFGWRLPDPTIWNKACELCNGERFTSFVRDKPSLYTYYGCNLETVLDLKDVGYYMRLIGFIQRDAYFWLNSSEDSLNAYRVLSVLSSRTVQGDLEPCDNGYSVRLVRLYHSDVEKQLNLEGNGII